MHSLIEHFAPADKLSPPLKLAPAFNLQSRKSLAKADFRTRHVKLGYILMGTGIAIAVAGPVNTYMRLGQLLNLLV